MARKSKTDYERTFHSIKECFNVSPSFWGIDKVTIGSLIVTCIDKEKLEEKRTSKRTFKITAGPDDNTPMTGIASIQIMETGYTFCAGRSECGCYALIDLISENGCNVRTQNIADIKNHLLKVENVLASYGIHISVDYATIRMMEIAYTTASDEISFWPRYYLMESYYKRGRSIILERPGKTNASRRYGDDVSTILVKNRRAVKTGISYVLYDKTREMLDKHEIDHIANFHIYRFEVKLVAEYVKQSIGTNKLTEISDMAIMKYIRTVIDDLAEAQRKRYIASIDNAKQAVRQYRSCTHAATATIKYLDDYPVQNEKLLVLDMESLVYTSEGGKNGSRNVKKYISAAEGTYLTELYGWTIEDIINDMLDSLCRNMVTGFGCIPSNDSNMKMNCFRWDVVSEESMREYMHYIGKKSKPRYRYILSLNSAA